MIEADTAALDSAYQQAVQLYRENRLGAAEEALRAIIARWPAAPGPWHLLGAVAMGLGRYDVAIQALGRSAQLDPGVCETWTNLGLSYDALGQWDKSIECHRRALTLRPGDGPLAYNLGFSQMRAGQDAGTEALLRQALTGWTGSHAPSLLLGEYLHLAGRRQEAESLLRAAITKWPDEAGLRVNLANLYVDQAETAEAEALYASASALAPASFDFRSNVLLAHQYHPDVSGPDLRVAHEREGAFFPAPEELPPWPVPGGRRLRVAMLSPDLGRHPVGHFLNSFLAEVRDVDITLFNDGIRDDDVTGMLQSIPGVAMERCTHLDHQALTTRLRDGRFDLAFDLAGHTAHNRLPVFARRVAPVQASWLGYVGTTGLAAMDYIIADRWHVRPEEEDWYRERIWRMPDGYLCYRGPPYVPETGSGPAESSPFTYGCLSNPTKLNTGLLDSWARILKRSEGSKLLLRYRGYEDPWIAGRIQARFASQGIDPARLDLRGPCGHRALFETYREIDVALDTFPYAGGVTTCEAIWMGVPVVTFPGRSFAGRHATSHMSNAGLERFVAADQAAYEDLAVSLAADRPGLQALRQGLREQVARSPLGDASRFARHFEQMVHRLAGGN